ncbi:MAG TPA: DNA-processing protein DprA [Polyangiaceae bacterium]|jgi:DNA processing protein|nr:DNA-processing protein DprA [Polyangiaceae bacterium]
MPPFVGVSPVRALSSPRDSDETPAPLVLSSGHVQVTPLDPRYPSRLRFAAGAPASITFRGGSLEAERVVAIVGSRDADHDALEFAARLAGELAQLGVVIASGGAIGIDRAAHEGTLAVGGRTWVVAPTGHLRCYPPVHADLFETIARGPGAVLWPFSPDAHFRSAFVVRNRVLVTLSDAVVVVQAREGSGALNAARWARNLKRPLWVVPAAPWADGFAGSHKLLAEGVRPLTSLAVLMASLGLAGPPIPADGAMASASPEADGGSDRLPLLPRALSPSELRVLRALSHVPLHIDGVATKARLDAQATGVALLTLALEDVVVEGPPGFFRRQNPR